MEVKFDLLELVYNHQIQIRFKRQTASGAVRNLRFVVDSRHDLSGDFVLQIEGQELRFPVPKLVKDIAAEFPYVEFENPDGFCCHADFIRVMDWAKGQVRYNLTEYVYKDRTHVVDKSKLKGAGVDCLEDLTAHPEKVQKFCNIVFTPEVKAQYIASLPRKEIDEYESDGVTPKTKPVEVPVPARTEPRLIDGQIVDFELEKATTRIDQVPVTQSFIEYKGNLYPEGWDGTL